MSPFPQTGQPVGGVGDGGDGAGGSPPPPLEPHDPELGLPLHVQRESLLHDPLLVMFAQLNGVGESVGKAVGGGVGALVGSGVGGFVGTGADVGCVQCIKENDTKWCVSIYDLIRDHKIIFMSFFI